MPYPKSILNFLLRHHAGANGRFTRHILVTAVMLLGCGLARADDTIAILPGQIMFAGPAAQQTIIVEQIHGGIAVGQIRDNLSLTSGNDKVLKIESGVAIPIANGTTTITATNVQRTATASVTVTGMGKPVIWSFRNDIQPVLTRAGCNSGACHGAAAGKNGFHLSLRGYDDDGDFWTLTRQFLGRRINPSDPGRSLMLLKPTTALPHKGGERFKVDSPEYRILSGWIAEGTPAPAAEDPRIQTIELIPNHVILKPGDSQQVLVMAHFSDGTTREVTHYAKFTATDSAVGSVSDEGLVKVSGHGEGAITAWYLSKIAVATVTSPYENAVSPDQYAGGRNLIDEQVNQKLMDLKLPPSPQSSDSEFLRRAFVDTIGVLPTAVKAREFLADTSPDKRDKLIELLLNRPEFVDYWSYKWSDLLLVSSRKLKDDEMWSYYHWVRDQVAANTPWDQFARQLVTATGSVLENGAANFFVLHSDPTEISETLSVSMLGMSINCARCHNHPMEKWTNGQYYGMANLFSRVRAKNGADKAPVVFSVSDGDIIQPLTGAPQPPRPLDGDPVAPSVADRRVAFADWLTSRDNPFFSRAISNRIWANFMGAGLVDKVDDMRASNPASNEKLLLALAGYLADQHYDLKQLMRLILQSQTYQRSSKPLAGNAADAKFHSHHYPRRIMAETLLDAASEVTASPTRFGKYPTGWRSMQLPDSNVDSYFLQSFGRADRILTCDCERTAEPSIAQAMNIANGDTVNQKLESKKNILNQDLAKHWSNDQIVEEAYLASLSRYPTPGEKLQIAAVLKDAKETDRRELLEDLYWGLLSSNEFLFDH